MPNRTQITPEIQPNDVNLRACFQSPRATTTPKTIQKPASTRLPVSSRSSGMLVSPIVRDGDWNIKADQAEELSQPGHAS